jgi:hypothetical protein
MPIDEAALQRLLDREAIREASLRYTRGIDRHDPEILARAYHPDAIDDHGAYIGGPTGFIHYANEVHARNWVSHHHYVTNQTIDLVGDSAHVETYFLAALRRPSGTVDMVGGRYVDRFERREGIRAVAERACLVEWNGELPSTTAAMDPDLFLRGTWDRSDLSYKRPLSLDRRQRDIAVGAEA